MNIVKQLKFEKLTARIYHDFRNPRRDYIAFGKIIVDNSKYNQHNILTEASYQNYVFSIADIDILSKNYSIYMPLYLEHNNVYIEKNIKKTTSNQIGWYVLTEQNLHSYLKSKQITVLTNQIFQQLNNKLIHEIELFNAYRNNNLYTYEIIDNQTNILTSSGLIIGLDNAVNKCAIYL